MNEWHSLKAELLSDPKTKAEYDALAGQYAVASQLIDLRIKKGLTQAQLAESVGTKQAAIARLESGQYNPSLKMLGKIAHAMGVTFTLKIG
ncbi:MAG: helix-turn-helix transcriptional regulator [bacterium]